MGPRARAIHDKSFQVLCDGEPIVEVDQFAIARAAFDAAATCFTSSTLVLKNGGRIIETVRTGLYDHLTKTVEVLERCR